MEYMEIGHSGIRASVITFGAMPIGGGTWWRNSDDEVSIDTIHRAYDLGINTIDTAPIYGLGHSEEVVGKAIAGSRDKYIISTKATFDWDTGVGRFWHEVDGHKVYVDHSYQSIIKDCENSLKRLGTDYIDIYYTHNPAKDPEKYPVEDTVRALMDLKKAGKIRCIGSSNVKPEHIEAYRACGCEIDIIQRKYSILTRNAEEDVIPVCEKYGMSFHAYAPIERGLLTGTVTKDRVVPPGDAREDQIWWSPSHLPHAIDFVDGLKDICEEYHCTQTDLAIAFIRHRGPFINVIYGARKIKHLEAGAATINVTLRDDTVAEIRRRAEELEAKYGS